MFFGSTKEESTETVVATTNEIKSKPQSNGLIAIPTSNLSVLNGLINTKGNIEGGGSLIIGGALEGNLNIEDTVFIQEGAKVTGNIIASSIKISGDLKGDIQAKIVEITQNGNIEGNIKSSIASVSGLVNGSIISKNSIEIQSSGVLDTKECKSQKIKVVGKVIGKVVASELLEVISGGSVDGTIITKGIRTEEGGTIIGNIQTFDPYAHKIEEPTEEAKESNEGSDVTKLINIDPKDIQNKLFLKL